MSTISLRLPEALHREAKTLAKEEGISMNQLIITALAEKMSALATETYLEERAARASREKFNQALDHVADGPPDYADD